MFRQPVPADRACVDQNCLAALNECAQVPAGVPLAPSGVLNALSGGDRSVDAQKVEQDLPMIAAGGNLLAAGVLMRGLMRRYGDGERFELLSEGQHG